MSTTKNYLEPLPYWSEKAAFELAKTKNASLTPDHLSILCVARTFYDLYGFSPSMRPLCKIVSENLGTELGHSVKLNQLFPGSPAKQVAIYAGLPAPKNCL
jgi:tRNA 2-thiouridine synthesizing protein E